MSSPLRLSPAQVVDGGFGDFAGDFGDVDGSIATTCSPGGPGFAHMDF